jgi:hypothetical protein
LLRRLTDGPDPYIRRELRACSGRFALNRRVRLNPKPTDIRLPLTLGTHAPPRAAVTVVHCRGIPSMCDYSLHSVASRPAKAGDKLVSKRFYGLTGGFAPVGEPNVAVCVLPGTEVAFEKEVEYRNVLSVLPKRKAAATTARFRRVNQAEPHAHHDALEFPDGQVVLLTRLCEGQHATVLQLPAAPPVAKNADQRKVEPVSLWWDD